MKKLLLLICAILFSVASFAESVEIDGIYYILDKSTGKAATTYSPNKYKGDVVIPESVEYNETKYAVSSIGSDTFTNCSELTSIKLPSSITSIGEYAFAYCESLSSIDIPNGVDSISSYVFHYCNGLTSITIPNSVVKIGDHAFESCKSLSTIDIPNSVTTIGQSAFKNCSFNSLTIPESITSIGSSAFSKCSIGSIHTPDLKSWCNIKFARGNYSNPLSVAHHLYLNNDEILELEIPEGVKSLDGTFDGAQYISSVTLPESLDSIGAYAFRECKLIENISLPNNVKSIGKGAFYGCDRLESIEIPNIVSYIGENAFAHCYSLSSIVLPDGLISIDRNAFKDCTGLSTISIPNSVTTIGESAFWGCTGLFDITIGKSVSMIDNTAFFYVGISSLNSSRTEKEFVVNCYAETVPATALNAFNDSPISSGKLFVNDNSVESYKTTAPWSSFGQIQGFNEASKVESLSVDSPTFDKYDLRGNAIGKSHKGISIIKPKKGKAKKVLVK